MICCQEPSSPAAERCCFSQGSYRPLFQPGFREETLRMLSDFNQSDRFDTCNDPYHMCVRAVCSHELYGSLVLGFLKNHCKIRQFQAYNVGFHKLQLPGCHIHYKYEPEPDRLCVRGMDASGFAQLVFSR